MKNNLTPLQNSLNKVLADTHGIKDDVKGAREAAKKAKEQAEFAGKVACGLDIILLIGGIFITAGVVAIGAVVSVPIIFSALLVTHTVAAAAGIVAKDIFKG
jgi:hypothetical protein